jgi:aspartyl-tRNA(Asn)/glutamyl-tRNA(Gln) amidotransferase subunit B
METVSRLEAVIGMEVHAELLTQSKMFCACSTQFGAPANSQCCPVCLGLPGSLPVINRAAVEHVLRTALALNCRINERSIFHRKNYFYPDLPKAYQISQYDVPIGVEGYLDVHVQGERRRIRIRRVHLEEDTGKLFHVHDGLSHVDYNRSGVPLMEVVSEPDIRSAEEAREYLVALRQVLVYIGASDGRMEQGSLRCEPNISVRSLGSSELGTKVELKNLNSFRSVHQGVEYELARQQKALAQGETVSQETRRWDEQRLRTVSMRSKEYAHDYRYFPEPDLVAMIFHAAWSERLRASLPELPEARRVRFVEQYRLPDYDAGVLTSDRDLAEFFDAAARDYGNARALSNWVRGDFKRLMNVENLSPSEVRFRPSDLAGLLRLLDSGRISGKQAKSVFEEMFRTGKSPEALVDESGGQLGSDAEVAPFVEAVIEQNDAVVAQIRGGKLGSLNFLVGQVMRETKGRANPELVRRLLKEKIGVE